jgi:hypothetical protein
MEHPQMVSGSHADFCVIATKVAKRTGEIYKLIQTIRDDLEQT